MKEDEINLDKMQESLSSIAKEIQTFNTFAITDTSQILTENEEILNQVLKYKSILKEKNKLIKKLKADVNTACVVAKTMMSVKENETASLNTLLHFTRSESADLYEKHTQTSREVLKLSEQNKILQTKLHTLENFIEIGFKQLPSSSENKVGEVSILNKLIEIIIYSNRSLLNYCSAKKGNNLQIKQCSSHMDKINNYDNEVIIKLPEDSQMFNNQNIRPDKEKMLMNNIHNTNDNICSYSNSETFKIEVTHSLANTRDFDLTLHLSIAKKLLDDQDELLQHLQYITREILTG